MHLERYIERLPMAGCWIWVGKIFNNGYGCVRVQTNGTRKHFLAHRVVYEEHRGTIPGGMDLDHLCRVRCCVNPSHLEPVSRRENLERGGVITSLRAMAAAKNAATHCTKGHEMTKPNTYVYPNGRHRACRICMREYRREWEKRNR